MIDSQSLAVVFLVPYFCSGLANNIRYSENVLDGLSRRFFRQTEESAELSLVKNKEDRLLKDLDEDDLKDEIMCDSALTKCMGVGKCRDCFFDLSTKDIDWASIPKSLACQEALKFLFKDGYCTSLNTDTSAQADFCVVFDSCVKTGKMSPSSKNSTQIDCSKLKSCDFEGMHYQFLGDGICHDKLPGCYNSEICGYDLGDCCKDTCSRSGSANCGKEGYACKDPASVECDKQLTPDCGKHPDWKDKTDDFSVPKDCPEGQVNYRLTLYDSFGDGWKDTNVTIVESKTGNSIFGGSLQYGSTGTTFICLNTSPTCYNVVARGGIWGKEASWDIRPQQEGARAIASGGAPTECQFAAGGVSCENTCLGGTSLDPTKDPNYKSYDTLSKCIKDKCPIQMAACANDEACNTCFSAKDLTPQYCYGVDMFNSLVDCALCSCSKTDFCDNQDGKGTNDKQVCSPSQIIQGSDAMLKFSGCTNFDEISMLMVKFDNNHFGDLDTFERCAHEYRKLNDHGGHTALSCMKILVNAMDASTQKTKVDPPLTAAVSALAGFLYQNGESFCDCAMQANTDCPLCKSFVNFKTLLYESVDACVSLDEIDCDAWNEFYPPCKSNVAQKFKTVDFTSDRVCQFIHDGCGDAGPFPSFRRLDCKANEEVKQEAWDFYQSYAKGCLKDSGISGGNNSYIIPAPRPSPSPVSVIPDSPGRKPYVPPEERDKKHNDNKDDSKNDSKNKVDPEPAKKEDSNEPPTNNKKQSHFFRNFFLLALLGVGGYYYYKYYGFSLEGIQGLVNFFRRLRRGRHHYDGEAMYSSLAMESSTSFEPASLPPLPSAVDSNYYI